MKDTQRHELRRLTSILSSASVEFTKANCDYQTAVDRLANYIDDLLDEEWEEEEKIEKDMEKEIESRKADYILKGIKDLLK